MREKEDAGEKGEEILRQMRDDKKPKKHLDQQKIRAEKALRRAIESGDEEAFLTALSALGIETESEAGKTHLRGFRQLRGNRY